MHAGGSSKGLGHSNNDEKNELILWKLSFIWIKILNDGGMQFEFNSIKFNEIQIQLDWIEKEGGMQIYEQAIWKICSSLSSSMTMVLEKVKPLQKNAFPFHLHFKLKSILVQWNSYLMKLKLDYLISPPMWTLNFCTLYQLWCYHPHWNY